ncbi:MAG: maleate cis-trans isomerase family protein [Acidimicrobiales bacterium]
MNVRTPIPLEWNTDEGLGSRARLGLIVLASDQTLENEIRSLPLPDVAIHHSRIPNEMHVSEETLTAMRADLPAAAALLPPVFGFDVIGYGCTSASTLIGDNGVEQAVQSVHAGVAVTNPIRAAVAAFSALGAHRIGVVTPYTEAVTLPIIERFEEDGLTVDAFGSFLIDDDLTVGRLSPAAVTAGLKTVAAHADCDAWFVSCTSIPLFSYVADLEAQLGAPVVSSNLALAWHLMRLAGIEDQPEGFGRLIATC